MPSAKQIKARKAFVKKYAKKGKRSKSTKSKKVKIDGRKAALDRFMKEEFKGKSDADLRRILRTKKGNTDDEGYELGRRMRLGNSKRDKLLEQQREPTRQEFKRAGYSESEIDDYFNRKWDKKMQEFLNKSNNES